MFAVQLDSFAAGPATPLAPVGGKVGHGQSEKLRPRSLKVRSGAGPARRNVGNPRSALSNRAAVANHGARGQWMARAGGGRGWNQGGCHAPPIPTLVGFTRTPWNKGQLISQKRPLKPKEVWAIRVRLQLERRWRDLALFNLAIDSKLRGCDLVRLRVNGGQVRDRATIIQPKTGQPVQFEITEQTRTAIRDWLADAALISGRFLFPSPLRSPAAHLDATVRPHRTSLGRASRSR